MNHHKDVETPKNPFNVRILKQCRDYTDRMIWQSIYIKQNKPKINTQLNKDKDKGWVKGTWELM